MKRAKIGFVSLGCSKNLVDTENMMRVLSDQGHVMTGNTNEADVVVVNTCGFLESAKSESMDTISEFGAMKKKKKLQGLIVAGCMTERYLGLMREKHPEVDAFIQTKEFSKVGEIVSEILNEDTKAIQARLRLLDEVESLKGHSEITDFVKRMPGQRSFAYVKIAEGCNRTCSFCIIPKLRGKLHSRSLEGILDEVRQLVAAGTREVVFIAQDLTSYGRDRNDGASLLELVKALDSVEGLEWYRLMYNYPRFFSDELIETLARSAKFARYLDIPFQHGSNRMLKAMRRPETREEILELIQKLRTAMPDLALRTTVMVGFPGETEQDFQDLLSFVELIDADHLGAFTYFQEKGTPSAELEGQIDEKTKKVRYAKLMKFQKEVQKRKLKSLKGAEVLVRVDSFSEKTKNGLIYQGRHRGQAPEIDGVTYFLSDEPVEIGTLVHARVDRLVGDYDLLSLPESPSLGLRSANRRC